MNILFFLTPKVEVAYVEDTLTIRQASEKFMVHSYTSVPVIDEEGHYVRSLSEGDLFHYIMSKGLKNFNHDTVKELKEERVYKTIYHNQNMEDLFTIIENQNYIPVLDDREIFIGIITRKSVIEYLRKLRTKDE